MKRTVYRRRQFFFLGLLCAFLITRLLLHPWDQEFLEECLDILGIGLIALGFIMRIAASGYLLQRAQGGENLVTEGPYRFVRHPKFLGTLFVVAGVVSLFLHISWCLFFLLIWMSVFIPDITAEEQRLAKRFDQKYARYTRRVPRFVPVLRSWLWLPDYFQIRLSWFKLERLSLVSAVAVTLVVEILIDAKLFGHQELLGEFIELLVVTVSYALAGAWFFLPEIREAKSLRPLIEKEFDANGEKIFVSLCFVTLLFFTGLVLHIKSYPVWAPDLYITRGFQHETYFAFWLQLMKIVSFLGDAPVRVMSFVLAALLFYITHNRREVLFLFFVAVANVMAGAIKYAVGRPRPTADMVAVYQSTHNSSFPSGHTVFFTIFYGFIILSMFYARNIPFLMRCVIAYVSMLLILTIGLARIYIGVHFATDVIGGYMIGFAFLLVIIYLYIGDNIRYQRIKRGGPDLR